MAGVDEMAIRAVKPRQHPTVVAGDAVRFERLWNQHYAAVHAHAERRVGTRADDVCAEVFTIAWRRLGELPRYELPWLLAASRNVIGTTWRGDARRARLQDRLDAGPHEADVQIDSSDPELEGVLARLGEPDRELLLLVYWEGLLRRGLRRRSGWRRRWRGHGFGVCDGEVPSGGAGTPSWLR